MMGVCFGWMRDALFYIGEITMGETRSPGMAWGLLLAGLTVLSVTAGPSFGQGIPVEAGRAVMRDISLRLDLIGMVQPQISTSVSAQVSGQIRQVYVNEGDAVRKGDVLAELNKDIIEVKLAQAEARCKQTENEFLRVKQLVEQRLTSLEKVQQVETELALRSADCKLAEITLAHATIRSPISGFVARKYVEIGEWISAGDTIVDVIKTDIVYALTAVSEQHIGRIRTGLKATISCDAYGEVPFQGTLKYIIPEADEKSHTFPVKIEVGNADGRLKSGMFVRVDLPVSHAEEVLMVPKDAIIKNGGEAVVFLVVDGKVRMVPVKTGRNDGDYVAVEGDLKPGATVVVTGNENLRDGVAIKVVRTF